MNRLSMRIAGPAFLFALALGASYTGNALAATCIGSCGTSTATDGVVTIPSGFSSVGWISTNGGVTGAGQFGGAGGTDGSAYTTSTFTATAGQTLQYNFNYITSDGAQYADYASVQLQTAGGTPVATLLTAQTEPSGSIIPAPGLPAISAGVTLNPASVPIIPGGPVWSPLGPTYSGLCYSTGCGYTGWVLSDYTIGSDGTYQLVFGVTTFIDTIYDSGLAFAGISVCTGTSCNPIGTTPLPAALPLFATGLGAFGLLGWRRKRKAAAVA